MLDLQSAPSRAAPIYYGECDQCGKVFMKEGEQNAFLTYYEQEVTKEMESAGWILIDKKVKHRNKTKMESRAYCSQKCAYQESLNA